MAECFYYKNKTKFNTIKEVVDAFYKDNYLLKNAAIFSSDEIQDSTLKKIRSIPEINNYRSNDTYENEYSLNATNEKVDGKETVNKIQDVLQFIVTPRSDLFKELNISTKTDRLVPEYIKENRIYSYVINNPDKLEKISDNINVSNLKYNSEDLKNLRKHSNLDSISDNKLIYMLSEINSIIEVEEKTKKFGTLLHKVISLKIENSKYSGIIDKFLSDPENKDLIGNASEEDWKNRIDTITNEVINTVKNIGIPLTELFLTSHIVKGKLDLIAVDRDGVPHIFEIKISKTKYEDWDSAKYLQLDWQLALYRQLLGQHLNVDRTQLYVIPIHIKEFGNPNSLKVEEFSSRTSIRNSGLNENGVIYERANAILPRKIISDYDPEREDRLKENLNILLPEYTIKTDKEDYDIDLIMERAKKRYEQTGKWEKFNSYSDIPGLENEKNNKITAKTEAEFRSKIEKYVAFIKSQSNREVTVLKNATIAAIKTNSSISTSTAKKDRDLTYEHLLLEFFNDEWDVVDTIPETTPLGLIVLKNKINGNINIISLSTHNFYQDTKIVDNKLSGDLEYYKTFLFINEFKDQLFPGGRGKVSQIIAYNPVGNKSYVQNVYSKYKEFKNLMFERNMQNSLKLTEDDISDIEDIALYNLNSGLRNLNLSEGEEKKISSIFEEIAGNTNIDDLDAQKLIDIQKEFYRQYPGYRDITFKNGVNFNDNKEVLLILLNVLIATKNKMILSEDFYEMSKWSLGFSDFKSLFAALYTRDQAKYDKEGRKIQGIVRGLLWTTPDWVDSIDLRSVNRLISTSVTHIGEKMVKFSNTSHIYTNEYYKAINFSRLEKDVIGETQSKHANLWRHIDGEIDPRFITKDPYKEDLENALSDPERVYLKKMLLIMNIFKLNISDSELRKIDINSLSSLRSNDKIAKALDSGYYFEMPLVRREELSRYKNSFQNTKEYVKSIPNYAIEFKDYLNKGNGELQKEDLNEIELQNTGYYEMYDVYGRQTKELKNKMVEKYGINYFDLNLDTLAHRLAFNKIRKNEFDKILPIINSYVWWMKLASGKARKDISKQLETIENQLKLAVFDDTLIDDEFKSISIVQTFVKKLSTAAMLSFRPITIAKELTLGVIKGITIASTQIYGKDQFTLADLKNAYGKLLTVDKRFASEFNLIDQLNHHYRFVNMDANSFAKRLQTDRHGVYKGLGTYMYTCNTVGDYSNRLSILIAKMIHDGSYEAHSFENGEFVYDPRKDQRFSYYLANRDKYKYEGKYIPAKNDEKYNTQRRRYLLLVDQLNDEYRGDRTFTEDTIVDKAYSAEERNSLKTMTDISYGYYEKDAQAQMHNVFLGTVFLQFMQFWPGKMTQWFAKPTDTSPMGKCIQEYETLESGEKVLIWRKPVLDENGDYVFENGEIKIEKTTENTGDPSLIWEASPYEGLAYSVFYTAQDLFRMDFKNIAKHEDRNRRVMFALADGAVIYMILSMVKSIWESLKEDVGEDGFTSTTINMMAALNNKVLNEQNVYQSTLGAINTTPVFISWGKKFGGDVIDVFKQDKTVMDAMERNVGATEFLKWLD